MNRTKKLLALLSALALAASIAGCAGGGQISEETSSSTSIVTATPEITHEDDIVIETGYGNLYFPEQWQEFLVTDQAEEGNTIEVSFSAKINENTFPLFSVTIGGEGDNPAGVLTGSDGTQRNVYVQIQELEKSDVLSESEQNRLYAMQEDINYLLDSLE